MLVRRGDTIVEVALAFTIFSMLAVGSIIIMSRGVAYAQRSLEVTQVRQAIDGQVDLLRIAQNSPIWSSIKSKVVTAAADVVTADKLLSSCPAATPKNGFIITKNSSSDALQLGSLGTANFSKAPVTSYVDYATSRAYGIWVQAVRVSGSPAAYDMYIRACWNTIGDDVPATLATIVRLYDAN